MNRYKKGYRFELDVKKQYESRGYKVVRSSGSHTPVDLIAMKNGEIIQIQCKNMKQKISKAEKHEIEKWAKATGFPVIIIYKTIKNETINASMH